MNYIMNHETSAECIFCLALNEIDGPANLVVARGQFAFVMMNRYPYTSGHVMVVPLQHAADLSQLSAVARAEMMELVTMAVTVIAKLYAADGFNVGANLGAAAGAGIADHLHWHVVPRWRGDTNFMATVANTRVLPESLADGYRRIAAAWRAG